MFISRDNIDRMTWQAFERAVQRLVIHRGGTSVRVVGQTNDGGADVLASQSSKRWLYQVKHWKMKVGAQPVSRTIEALRTYRAHVPALVSLAGFTRDAYDYQQVMQSEGIPLQMWDRTDMANMAASLQDEYPVDPAQRELRKYQCEAIEAVVRAYGSAHTRRAMIVLATGLGKTWVAAETYRRLCLSQPTRILVLAHTNPIVYQLERAFWPFLKASQDTVVWNGLEKPLDDLAGASCVFACIDTVFEHISRGNTLPDFDMVLVDECHHVGGKMYDRVLDYTRAGLPDGPFLLGLTATPWRPDEVDLRKYFGEPLVTVDLVTGLRNGFLANVDYRMYTDNIDWSALSSLSGDRFSPRQINRTLFINEWDESVVHELRGVWAETPEPRAIVFCGTIAHAYWMRDHINAQGFCAAEVVVSQDREGGAVPPYVKNRVLCDFSDGIVQVVCAVDIFNEGVDVPDVNIVVFQRVTHSRRIFIQQLGRGLRLCDGKEKVVVLDFVSDIRRFAAGLELKRGLEGPVRVKLPSRVTFQRVGGADPRSETFLRQWLDDVAAVEEAGEDAAVLAFPPRLDPAP